MNGLAAIYIAVGAKDFFLGELELFVLEGFPDLAPLGGAAHSVGNKTCSSCYGSNILSLSRERWLLVVLTQLKKTNTFATGTAEDTK
jgi:hypothetical protein